MHKKITQGFESLKQKLCYPLLKQPAHLKKLKTKLIIISIFFSFFFDAISFTLKGAQYSLENGHLTLAIGLLILYFSERMIRNTYNTYKDYQQNSFDQIRTNESINIILGISSIVREKVLKEKNGNITTMSTAELLEKLKTYQIGVWSFFWKIPEVLFQVVSLTAMIVVAMVIEYKTNSSQANVLLIMITICLGIYFYLSRERIKLLKHYRQTKIDQRSEVDNLFTEIKSIGFISRIDYMYHAERFRKSQHDTNSVMREEALKLNFMFIKRGIVVSLSMIGIMFYKFWVAPEITIDVFLDVIAFSSIYSTILQRIASIMDSIEQLLDVKIDIDTLHPTFDEIYKIYEEEISKRVVSENVKSVTVRKFEASQDPKKVFKLINQHPFTLAPGDIVLIYGPTGSGKSTLINLLTGNIRIAGDPIQFSNGDFGYLSSIAYQTDKSMAVNIVLSEIILDDDVSRVDWPKLKEILQGLCLYDEILRIAKSDKDISLILEDDETVLKVLETRKTDQFSSGQRQRLALCKLLYTMDESINVIALDEAFNRLDDDTALKCSKFIAEYSQRGINRIVLLATHQVSIIKSSCNKQIYFDQQMSLSFVQNGNL